MANRTHYLQYYIHLTDKTQFNAAVASVGSTGGWLMGAAPDDVAITYDAELILPGPGQNYFPPCINSGYFGTSANYPTNVASFTRKSGGWFGIHLLFGDTHTYRWSGQFVYAGVEPGETEVPGEPGPVAMPIRLWVEGFEAGAGSGTGNAVDLYGPHASRHQGGFGFAARNGAGLSHVHRHIESGHAVTDRGWERLYVRLRQAPQSSQTFWSMQGATSSLAGGRLRWTISGAIECVNSDNLGALSTVGTSSPLTVDRWYKLDILYRYGVSGTGFLKIYIGGVEAISVTAAMLPAGTGITQAQNIFSSTVHDGNSSAHRGSWDMDDWICSELPAGGVNPALFPQRDWNTGSKVVPLRPKAAAASNGADWAGPGGLNANDFRYLMQRPVVSSSTLGLLTSVASPRAAVVTDADRSIDLDSMNLGIAAVAVIACSLRAGGGAADCLVGLKLAGGAEVTRTPFNTEATVFAGMGRGQLIYTGGTIEPVRPNAGIEVSFTGNTTAASAKNLYNIVGQAECLGNFYIEDYVPQTGDPASITDGFPIHWTNDLHQHPFALGPWAPAGQAAPSIVVNHGGTFVGNGTSQTLAFRTPPTWLFIRNTATQECTFWLVSGATAHQSFAEGSRPSQIPRVYIDPNFAPAVEDDQSQQTLVVIAGNLAALNQSGVTYNYMCVQDAGQRFMEAGSLWEHGGGTVERLTRLNNAGFTPEYLWVHRTQSGNATTRRLYVKGLGLVTANLNLVGAAAIATALEMREGSLALPASSTLYHTSGMGNPFLALRRDDGSEDAGIPNVMQLASWTGDGTASRTIGLSPATGRRPMWALVVGSDGAARMRDPVHTGVTSLNAAADTTDATTGITAGGIDSITVGSAGNANGVLYEAYIIPSCTATAGNNGWGLNCESIPVEPKSPVPPYEEPPGEVPPEPGETPNPCGTPNLIPTGTITQCAGPSTLVINAALSQLGVTKQLVSTTLNTEVSQEATVCRLHFDEDVRKCLRDFPWPFATRYSKLTAIGGPADLQDLVQAYSATAAYTTGMVVQVAGVNYYAVQGSTGQAVTNPVYWTTTAPLEFTGDWVYAYLAPTDMLFARRLVDPDKRRRTWDPEPPTFRVGSWGNNPILYANEENVELEYTHLSGCVAYQGDALFRSALSWRHAHSIAPGLSRDAKLTGYAWEMYQRLLRDARASGAQEQQQDREGDVDWIAGRN